MSELFRIGQPDEPRTAWGTPGTENWGQVGFPWGYPRELCYQVNGKQRCVDTNKEWGWGSQYKCGGNEPEHSQPGLASNDYTNFFWACTHLTESGQQTANSQWVPVKRPQPGVDYTRDHQLVRPGGTDYNEDCRYKDDQGNPTPAFRADFHPHDHPNPQLRGKPVRINGVVQGTTIHGANWDPLAQTCTTRGNR